MLLILLTFAFHNFSCLSATSWSQRKYVHHALWVTSRMVIVHRSIQKYSFLHCIMKLEIRGANAPLFLGCTLILFLQWSN